MNWFLFVIGIGAPVSALLHGGHDWSFGIFGLQYAGSPTDRSALVLLALMGAVGVVTGAVLYGLRWAADAALTVAAVGVVVPLVAWYIGRGAPPLEPLLLTLYGTAIWRRRRLWRADGGHLEAAG